MFLRELAGVYLGEGLKLNETLRELCLTQNKIGTLGINRIIESLFTNKSLNSIDFGRITNESFKYLNNLLKHDHTLEILGFQEGFKIIAVGCTILLLK